MRGRGGGLLIGVLAGVLALTAAGCGGGDDDGGGSAGATTAAPATTAPPETTAAAGGGDNEIKLVASGFKFDKTSLDLTSGSSYTVEVRNHSSEASNYLITVAFESEDGGRQLSTSTRRSVARTLPMSTARGSAA